MRHKAAARTPGLHLTTCHLGIQRQHAVRPDHRGRAVVFGAPCACGRRPRHLTGSARNDATGVRWTKRRVPSLFVSTAKICFWRCSRTRKKRNTPPKTTKHRQLLSIFAHLSVNTQISGVHEQKMSVDTPKNGGGFREHKCHWGGRSSRPIDRPSRVCASSRRWCEYHRPVEFCSYDLALCGAIAGLDRRPSTVAVSRTAHGRPATILWRGFVPVGAIAVEGLQVTRGALD